MTITITEDGYICDSAEKPISGRKYYLEPADEYTPPMRRLWEALVEIAYQSGTFSYDTTDKWRFREYIKKDYGEGFAYFEYSADDHSLIRVQSLEDVPRSVLDDFATNHPRRIKAVLRSTTTYSKAMFSRMIDRLIDAMHEREIDTPKFRDIIQTITELK